MQLMIFPFGRSGRSSWQAMGRMADRKLATQWNPDACSLACRFTPQLSYNPSNDGDTRKPGPGRL